MIAGWWSYSSATSRGRVPGRIAQFWVSAEGEQDCGGVDGERLAALGAVRVKWSTWVIQAHVPA